MKNVHTSLALVCAAVMLVACGTAPKHPVLEEARSGYNTAQSDPTVTKLAALELQEAGKAVENAERAHAKGEDKEVVDHLALVAKQRVLIAQEIAKQKTTEAEVANANLEREKVRLEMRTAEAEAAKQKAAAAEAATQRLNEQLAAAKDERERERERLRLEAQAAEAKQQAELAQQSSSQKEAELEAINAKLKQMETELNELNAKKTERGMVITLGDVLFDTNKSQLKAGGIRNLEKLAAFFNEYPERKALIEGFTDSTGDENYNQQLSERRANAVRTALVEMGIGAERLSTRGYGENFPVAGNDTAAGRQMNRRVEIVLSDDQGNVKSR